MTTTNDNIYDLTKARLASNQSAQTTPELTLITMQLPSLPGFPCLAFYDAQADVSFNISPSGLLATDPESPTAIAFPAMLLGPTGKLAGLNVKDYVVACVNKFDLRHLVDSEGNGELLVHAEPIEALGEGGADLINMRVYFTLSPDAYERASSMILRQALAIKMLAEHAASSGSQTPTQTH